MLRNPKTLKIEYVGRGDAASEIAQYTRPGGKHAGLIGEIVFENELTLGQAKSLEQELQQLFGGPRSTNPETPLRNKIQGLGEQNPDFIRLEFEADDKMLIEALRRLRILDK